jgi:hypothetical protein
LPAGQHLNDGLALGGLELAGRDRNAAAIKGRLPGGTFLDDFRLGQRRADRGTYVFIVLIHINRHEAIEAASYADACLEPEVGNFSDCSSVIGASRSVSHSAPSALYGHCVHALAGQLRFAAAVVADQAKLGGVASEIIVIPEQIAFTSNTGWVRHIAQR